MSILLLFWIMLAYAQGIKKYTVSGYLRDGYTTESLIDATIYSPSTHSGTVSNQHGFYSITLPEGAIWLNYSYVGYATETVRFNLNCDTVIHVNLFSDLQLDEITITASKPIHEQTRMSVIQVPLAQMKSLPALLGESDLLKTLQLLPGVQSGGEGRNGLYVRGGGPDQNLFLLDGVPVYNVSHLFGFFSVFNADAINNVEITKGGFPARYGERISSVIDIRMKEGNMQKFHAEGSVGIISSKLTLEGPVWKNKTSFIISGRRTLADLVILPFINSSDSKTGYYFYDVTAKVNHRFSENDRIFLSAYLGDDVYHQHEKENSDDDYGQRKYQYRSDMKWGNITSVFRWNHVFGPKLFSNTSLLHSRYRYQSGRETQFELLQTDYTVDPPVTAVTERRFYASEYLSKVTDWGGRVAFDYYPLPEHYIRFGANASYHTYTPGAASSQNDSAFIHSGATTLYGMEYSVYAEDDIEFGRRLKVNLGIHWSGFGIDGHFYQSWQPRIAARYLLTEQLSLKAAYSHMAQYVHLLTNTNIGMQMDLWIPSTGRLKPQTSRQAALGVAYNFRKEYEISFEGYYKTMDGAIEYKEGITFLDPDETWEEKVTQGKGQSYGLEFFAHKKSGDITGWIGYTLSWTDRKFDELNNGERFYYKYDRRHDLSLVFIKQFSARFEVSATWVLGSGTRMTVPVSIYRMVNPIEPPEIYVGIFGYLQDNAYIDYNTRNSYRMEAYHRMDISASLIKKKKWGERRWVFSIYNAYNKRNPFYIDIKEEDGFVDEIGYAKKYEFVQYNLFPIVPSISYQFKF